MTQEERLEKIEKIVNNIYRILDESDEETQSDKAIEELSELIRAIVRYRQSPPNDKSDGMSKAYKNLMEEIADVQIMLCQLTTLYAIFDDELYNLMLSKTERTLERLGANDNR